MYTLGINAVFHDSAACLVKDGVLLSAAEEERFTGYKHGKRPIPFSTYELPYHAIAYCLEQAGLHLSQVDHIAYSFNPQLCMEKGQATQSEITIPFFPDKDMDPARKRALWENLFLSSILNAPDHLVDGYPHHLQKFFTGSSTGDWEWHFVDHHLAHAASAFLPSPFSHAAVMTLDGRGENVATTYSLGAGIGLTGIAEVPLPHSLGLLYEQVTTYLGFLHSSDEYKVMALASYGKPEYLAAFRDLVQVGRDGQYTIKQTPLEQLFGPARLRSDEFSAKHFNIARSLQLVLEESVLELSSWLRDVTRAENLCLAGGVALNCVLNARLRDESGFKNVWAQPASGDSGTALGAALWIDNSTRTPADKEFVMEHAYWGPEYTDDEIEKLLQWAKVPYRKMDDVATETAEILAADKIIGWFQGRMEFGPRALGSRSILASPISPDMQARLNEVKDREDFRPVAPVVLQEDAAEWFEGAVESPFMLFVNRVAAGKEDLIPAVRHVDGTARIQTVNAQQHPEYHALLKAFKQKTGVPVLVNTSFNILGKPIVCTPKDAISCFWTSPFDALIMGSFLIEKANANKSIGSYTNLQQDELIA
ncbi:carbamoyltransferase [Pedobacter yulinensis]|uniref:Carbamoyltransferase n=1 Tax=Pedobacter yulinensis TaxID=2126353 RepID=A0A2T3HK18_9SPHI|nr:carbamoyltransferase C-terminal domain-containing protein [Pedobacter yulinensis]PST82808.1 carbamoyltransferase [Pedobacter yulinensis]